MGVYVCYALWIGDCFGVEVIQKYLEMCGFSRNGFFLERKHGSKGTEKHIQMSIIFVVGVHYGWCKQGGLQNTREALHHLIW